MSAEVLAVKPAAQLLRSAASELMELDAAQTCHAAYLSPSPVDPTRSHMYLDIADSSRGRAWTSPDSYEPMVTSRLQAGQCSAAHFFSPRQGSQYIEGGVVFRQLKPDLSHLARRMEAAAALHCMAFILEGAEYPIASAFFAQSFGGDYGHGKPVSTSALYLQVAGNPDERQRYAVIEALKGTFTAPLMLQQEVHTNRLGIKFGYLRRYVVSTGFGSLAMGRAYFAGYGIDSFPHVMSQLPASMEPVEPPER